MRRSVVRMWRRTRHPMCRPRYQRIGSTRDGSRRDVRSDLPPTRVAERTADAVESTMSVNIAVIARPPGSSGDPCLSLRVSRRVVKAHAHANGASQFNRRYSSVSASLVPDHFDRSSTTAAAPTAADGSGRRSFGVACFNKRRTIAKPISIVPWGLSGPRPKRLSSIRASLDPRRPFRSSSSLPTVRSGPVQSDRSSPRPAHATKRSPALSADHLGPETRCRRMLPPESRPPPTTGPLGCRRYWRSPARLEPSTEPNSSRNQPLRSLREGAQADQTTLGDHHAIVAVRTFRPRLDLNDSRSAPSARTGRRGFVDAGEQRGCSSSRAATRISGEILAGHTELVEHVQIPSGTNRNRGICALDLSTLSAR